MTNVMKPINGKSKAKRIKWGDAQNVISWTYMKMLRESGMAKIYDSNPYVEVYKLQENVYGLFNQNNDGAGDVWMYIVVGPEKAMIIDTACGLGNQVALIKDIIGDMPFVVVNTHLGPDHSFGNCRYDTVYCHKYEVDNINSKVKPGMFDYLFDEKGNNIWLEFDKKDLPVYKDYNLIGLENHHIFNLGEDYDIEMIWTGGHAAGHCMYLDKKSKYLFAGDDVCSDVIGCGNGPKKGLFYNEYRNIQTYCEQLEELVKRIDEYDYIFPGHFMVNIESRVMLDILDTIHEILKDPKSYDYAEEHINGNGEKNIRMYKYVRGFGSVGYTENGVYRKGE